jgi:Glycosyl transferase family 90
MDISIDETKMRITIKDHKATFEYIIKGRYENNATIYSKVFESVADSVDDCSFTMSLIDEYNNTDLCCSRPKKINDGPKLCSIWGLLEGKRIDAVLKTNIDFSIKIPKAVWRGSTTGADELYSNPSLQKYSRLEIVRLSKEFPDLINAKFTSLLQYCKKRPEKFRNIITEPINELTKFTLDPIKQIQYKYIISADGNVASYSLLWALASGSVVLKQDSEHIQFIEVEKDSSGGVENPKDSSDSSDECCIKPYVHYVPIKRDFSDLVSQIEWLQNNELKAREIANNSRAYASKYFTHMCMKRQLCDLLNDLHDGPRSSQ